ncbi:hypothetical protein PF004_g6156 [Phytophthora fragariae]|uniref:Secreted protein n=1 Tax=Phytophthora fragariae TaxID=53985 RepID=A0A6G0PDQ8_9STRA|nr:hypothetical protein PF004_g6156 [Phytophthora fragariae]
MPIPWTLPLLGAAGGSSAAAVCHLRCSSFDVPRAKVKDEYYPPQARHTDCSVTSAPMKVGGGLRCHLPCMFESSTASGLTPHRLCLWRSTAADSARADSLLCIFDPRARWSSYNAVHQMPTLRSTSGPVQLCRRRTCVVPRTRAYWLRWAASSPSATPCGMITRGACSLD